MNLFMQSFFLSLIITLQNYPTAVTPPIRGCDNPANDPLQSRYMAGNVRIRPGTKKQRTCLKRTGPFVMVVCGNDKERER